MTNIVKRFSVVTINAVNMVFLQKLLLHGHFFLKKFKWYFNVYLLNTVHFMLYTAYYLKKHLIELWKDL